MTVLQQSTFRGPALASSSTHLFVAWCGTDQNELGRFNFMRSTDGVEFKDKFTGTGVDRDLSLAYYGNRLFYGHSNKFGGQVQVVESDDALTFHDHQIPALFDAERTDHVPGLCQFAGKLFIAFTGPDKKLNVCSYNGQTLGQKVTLNEEADQGVALATNGAKLFIAWAGIDNDNHLNVKASSDGINFADKVTSVETTDRSPALAWCHNKLYLMWKGKNNNKLNMMSSSDGKTFDGKYTRNDTTDECPSVAAFKNELYLAWRGRDPGNHVNVSLI